MLCAAAARARLAAAAAAAAGLAAASSLPRDSLCDGVLGEYRKPRRQLQLLEPPVEGFFAKEMVVYGVPIRSHACVSEGFRSTATSTTG